MQNLSDNNTLEAVSTAPVKFTPTALEELHRIYDNLEVKEDAVLRVGVKGGGCSGLSYLLAFDKGRRGQ
jgi:iron-sulfur cluster assembly protein